MTVQISIELDRDWKSIFCGPGVGQRDDRKDTVDKPAVVDSPKLPEELCRSVTMIT